jgi:hypothetical protein
MSFIKALLLCILLLLGLSFVPCKGQSASPCEWLDSSLKEVNKIHIGSTRADLEKEFSVDGGAFSSFMERRYVYKQCRYIKLDITFKEFISKSGKKNPEMDNIVKISKPYLERPFSD